jgi:WD40 repeat protein
VRPFESSEVALTWVAFNRRGTRLLTADGEGDVMVWDTRTGARVHILKFHVATVSRTEFSPNGRWIVTAGPTAAGVWDAHTGELLLVLRGHVSALTSASFGPDSRAVVTSSTDGTVRTGLCEVCTNLKGLRAIGQKRLAEIVRARAR